MTFLLKLLVKLALETVILTVLVIALRGKGRPKSPTRTSRNHGGRLGTSWRFAQELTGNCLKLLLVCLAVVGAFFAYDLLLRWLFGYAFYVLMIIATGIVLMFFGRLKLKPAATTSGVFLLVHVLFAWFL